MKVAVGIFLLFLQCLNGFSYSSNDCVCGQMNYDDSTDEYLNRIINGTVVPPHKYPWMVSIQTIIQELWLNVCAGSIISDKTILSAGHCVMGVKKDSYPIRFVTGLDIISEPSANQIYYHNAIIKHPYFHYDKYTDDLEYDFAMIIVDRRIKFSILVSPICLPSPHDHEIFVHQEVTAIGWGSEEVWPSGMPQEMAVLMEIKVRLLSNEECTPDDADDHDHELIRNALICTLGDSTGICYGDSGGPVFGNYDVNHHVILGVASYVDDDFCASGVPDYFARVPNSFTLNWIYNIIEKSDGIICSPPNFFKTLF